jgi:predicted nuclease of predicted toxin-antitoxin system
MWKLWNYARAHDDVVLTHDLDFGTILAAMHGEKPSVIQVRSDDVSPDSIGKQVVIALHQMASELDDGALLTIDPSRTRLRVLPLQPRGK